MTIFAESGAATRRQTAERQASLRHYVMTPPQFFAVEYAINPWMDTTNPVDTDAALSQWQRLQDIYVELGHSVDLVVPVTGLPDMVYAANGGLIIDGTALVARFKYPQRQQESTPFTRSTSTKARVICCLSVTSSWPGMDFAPRCGHTARSPGSSTAG
jgi:hypothetical protein